MSEWISVVEEKIRERQKEFITEDVDDFDSGVFEGLEQALEILATVRAGKEGGA